MAFMGCVSIRTEMAAGTAYLFDEKCKALNSRGYSLNHKIV